MNNNEIRNLINKKELEIKKLQVEVEELKRMLNQSTSDDTELSLSRNEKIKVFMNYFRGRDDVYPYLSIDKNNPKIKYYIPACVNDYGYAASPSSTSNWTTTLYKYNSITNNNWMYRGLWEWTISRNSGTSSSVFAVDSNGYVYYSYNVNDAAFGVRPSFYLSSDVQIKSGDGSYDNPYRLSI